MALEMTSTLLQNAPFHRIFPPIKGHFIDTYVRARDIGIFVLLVMMAI